MRTEFSPAFIAEIYSIEPSNTVLQNVEHHIRAALHDTELALVDDLFIILDANKLHLSMVEALERATSLYSACLPNRSRFLIRAFNVHTRRLEQQLRNYE